MPVERVTITPAAEAVPRRLGAAHGPLVFHQSGGCCDGSSPMCYPRAEFRIGGNDVCLGSVAGVPFYIGGQQYEYWQHTHLTVDVVPGVEADSRSRRRRECASSRGRGCSATRKPGHSTPKGPPPRGPDAFQQVVAKR